MKIIMPTMLLPLLCAAPVQASEKAVHTHAEFVFDQQILKPSPLWPQLYLEATPVSRGILLSEGKLLGQFEEVSAGKGFCHLGLSQAGETPFVKPKHVDLQLLRVVKTEQGASLELVTPQGPHLALACFQKLDWHTVAPLPPSYSVIQAALGQLGSVHFDGLGNDQDPAGKPLSVDGLVGKGSGKASQTPALEDCFE